MLPEHIKFAKGLGAHGDDAGGNMAGDYAVIARIGASRQRQFDGRVTRAGRRPPLGFREVYGPDSYGACLIWLAIYCDPLPEWRGEERRVIPFPATADDATP